MHSSSLNRGLLMAAMELLPTVYCNTPKRKKKKTLNNKKNFTPNMPVVFSSYSR
jgi:hypothetical protein